MVSRIVWLSICAVLFSACLGCEEEGIPKYPVTGSVTYKGKPLEGAIISFTPKSDGRPASTTTDSEGKYSLSTDVNGDGAVAGEYAVTIAKYDRQVTQPPPPPSSDDELEEPVDITEEYPAGYDEMDAAEKSASVAKNLLPRKFASPATSPLQAQVTDSLDGNVFDFDLGK